MPSALEELLALRDDPARFDSSPAELQARQLDAANERFETQIDQIPLLKNRAEAAGLTSIRTPDDLVPLLLAHNTYKSYSEAWLAEGQWERMSRWLQTVSTYQADGSSFAGVDGLDAWVERLEEGGQFVACSSGTTGKPAMLSATDADLDFASQANVSSFSWATGVPAANDRRFFGLGPRTNISKNERTRQALVDAFHDDAEEPYQLPLPMITTGAIMAMILLRRKITDGTAVASEVAEFERLSAARLAGMEGAVADAIDELVKSRDKPLFLSGMWASLHPLAVGVRERGYTGEDYGENTLFVGGGLKGANLPPDYREFVHATFGINDQREYGFYSMQEVNTPFPACGEGRYHIPAWVITLPLDEPGEQLLDATGGEVEARAAFFDLSLEGRWGGIISGDKVSVSFDPCSCGRQGPTIGREIVRFADQAGGDKISCAGTINAYVTGAA